MLHFFKYLQCKLHDALCGLKVRYTSNSGIFHIKKQQQKIQ